LLLSFISVTKISCSSKSYSRQETIENFEKKEKEILLLADYFTHLKADSNEVSFQPNGNRYTISIGLPNWAISPEHPYNAGRDMKINSTKMDTLLRMLGWTANTVLTLKEMLIKANCKYISSHGDYLQLDYGTGDVCSFWYIISKRPFVDSIVEKDTKLGVTFLRNNVRIGSSCSAIAGVR
jgi:hypothetical protein